LKSYLNKHYESSCFKDSSKDHHATNGSTSGSNGSASVHGSVSGKSANSQENLPPNLTNTSSSSGSLNNNGACDKHGDTGNALSNSTVTRSKVLQQNGVLKRKLSESKLE